MDDLKLTSTIKLVWAVRGLRYMHERTYVYYVTRARIKVVYFVYGFRGFRRSQTERKRNTCLRREFFKYVFFSGESCPINIGTIE